jgi:hypothetical protein
VLSPTPFKLGGGWSQEVVRSLPGRPSRKRPSVDSGSSNGLSKRQRTEIEVDNTETEAEVETETEDTAAELETETGDNEVTPPAASLTGCNATPATVLDSEPSIASSRSLGDSIPPSRTLASEIPPSQNSFPTLPPSDLIAPITGPVHTRLRRTLLERSFDRADRTSQAAHTAQSQANANESQTADMEKLPETEFNSAPSTFRRAALGSLSTPRTYSGSRSFRPSNPNPNPEVSAGRLTPSQLIGQERARAVAAKARAAITSTVPDRRRTRLFVTALRDPTDRPQARPPLGARSNAVGRRMGGPRQLDPVSAARADMVAFNRAVAHGDATSLAESVIRQSQRTARCMPPVSRPSDGLLDDSEEILAQAEAYAKGKWPVSISILIL